MTEQHINRQAEAHRRVADRMSELHYMRDDIADFAVKDATKHILSRTRGRQQKTTTSNRKRSATP